MIISLFSFLVYENESLHRYSLILVKKLLVKGSIEKVKIVLEWLIDYCRLIAKLLNNKYIA